eukprot:15127569-Alexandrium_andersonii.AAC.1
MSVCSGDDWAPWPVHRRLLHGYRVQRLRAESGGTTMAPPAGPKHGKPKRVGVSRLNPEPRIEAES